MSFKKGDQVTIKGIGGVFVVDCKVYRFCQSLGRPYYKFLLSNGSEYWGTELRAYVWTPVLYKAMYQTRSFAPRFGR